MPEIPFLDLQSVNAPIQEELDAAVERVLHSGHYLRGAATAQFEQAYASYIGTRHCVGVSNGLDALTLIFRAYKELGVLSEGDEVIIPANTYIATMLAVVENGLVPVLVEPDVHTLQIDAAQIASAVTPRTRCLLIVHLYGRCAYSQQIEQLCAEHHLLLVEDNAQAHGCQYQGRRTGSLGHAAGHSFYPTKPLGAFGDAGAVTTDDEALAQMVRTLANYGSAERYRFDYLGRNCRIDELQAAILSVKLRHLDADNAHRCALARIYYDTIQQPLVQLPEAPEAGQHVYHLFPVLCERRDALQAFLLSRGIHTDIHYPIPPHQQAAATVHGSCFVHGPLPLTEQLHRQELSLPLNTALTLEQAAYIAEQINQFESF